MKILLENKFVLTEGAIVEPIRRSGKVDLHPQLANALLIYDKKGKKILGDLYRQYIQIAIEAEVPIIISTPTWRANQERLCNEGITENVNRDAVEFLKEIREEYKDWGKNVIIAGLLGCKNDCYLPEQGLTVEGSIQFHSWQIQKLAESGVDVFVPETLPALNEAVGIAKAITETDIPYIISFVINREGFILDGNSLQIAFNEIDSQCRHKPLGYMINCAYPSFLNSQKQSEYVLSRLIGFKANASSLDQKELDNADSIKIDKVEDWGTLMIQLNKQYGVTILGGCCGTGEEHLRFIVNNK